MISAHTSEMTPPDVDSVPLLGDGDPRHGVWVVVVAAGSGTRFGAPKQFLDLAGERVIDRSVAGAAGHADGVVVVLPADRLADAALASECRGAVVVAVAGADSRAGSVRAGLAAVPDDADVILVHDGARPLAGDAIYAAVVAAVRKGADAAVPSVPVTDTIRRQSGGVVDRSELLAVQTPQGFVASVLRAAHASGTDATDDATLVEAAGGTVVLVPGDPRNLKLTSPADQLVAEALLAGQPEPSA
jgi:2-C-methyl-D-erythritol 4-phosphate cytidylyltransferase